MNFALDSLYTRSLGIIFFYTHTLWNTSETGHTSNDFSFLLLFLLELDSSSPNFEDVELGIGELPLQRFEAVVVFLVNIGEG